MASRLSHATRSALYTLAVLLSFCTGSKAFSAVSQVVPDSTTKPIAPDTTKVSTASESPVKTKKHAGSIIKRFFKNFDEYDTNYIAPNYYNYTAMLQNTNFYQIYTLKGTNADGNRQTLQMHPSPSLKIGPYFGWRWIFLGYTFDVMHPQKAGKATEFNLSLYSSMLGCDFVYINNTGDFTLRKVTGFSDDVAHSVKNSEFSGMEASTLSFTAYYVLNHRHFSYPAAYAQSTVQRKSCGSWMFGFSFSKQHLNFDYTQLPDQLLAPLNDELKINKIDYRSYSLSAGYAYNWVFAPQWLFSISLMPAIGFKQAKGERLRGETIWLNMKNMSFDFIGRTGLVWNNSHYFAGASLVTHFYDYKKNSFAVNNVVNYVNVYVGLMLHKKRQYRNQR